MVRGQILFSALVVNAGSTVQTMHRVSMTRVSTSELNWAASWIRPSRMLGRKGCSMCVLSDSFSWSQYLNAETDHLSYWSINLRSSFLNKALTVRLKCNLYFTLVAQSKEVKIM